MRGSERKGRRKAKGRVREVEGKGVGEEVYKGKGKHGQDEGSLNKVKGRGGGRQGG